MPHIAYIFSDLDFEMLIRIMLNKERTKKLSYILRSREVFTSQIAILTKRRNV